MPVVLLGVGEGAAGQVAPLPQLGSARGRSDDLHLLRVRARARIRVRVRVRVGIGPEHSAAGGIAAHHAHPPTMQVDLVAELHPIPEELRQREISHLSVGRHRGAIEP